MSLGRLLLRELAGLVDLLLPAACLLCGTELGAGHPPGFCTGCHGGFRPVISPRCPRCALPYQTEGGADHLCEACLRHPPPFCWIRPLGLYESSLRTAVQNFKYRAAVDLDAPLARLLATSAAEEIASFSPHLLIPVPLHRARLRERTYNQSLLLARRLGRLWNLPVEPKKLLRVKATAPQQGLSAAARQHNLRGAFALKSALDGERVLLIDDVVTTGATVRECARTLRRGGASAVAVAVLARASRHLT